MVKVIVTGFPGDVQVPLLLKFFRKIFKKTKLPRFWIKEMCDVPGTDFKSVTIAIYGNLDPELVVKDIEGTSFIKGELDYPLTADIEEDDPNRPPSPSPPPRKRKRKNKTERSQSPLYNDVDEVLKIDMEIKLLEQKRQLLEEERKLQQRKMELVKEFGPNALDSESVGGESGPRRRRPPKKNRVDINPPQPPRGSGTPQKNEMPPFRDRLPNFYSSCNKLLGDMRETIRKHTTNKSRTLVCQVLRTSLRKRLAMVIGSQNKKLTPTEIVAMYREVHPVETDDQFVSQVIDDIKACNLSKEPIGPTDEEKKLGNNKQSDEDGVSSVDLIKTKNPELGDSNKGNDKDINFAIDEDNIDWTQVDDWTADDDEETHEGTPQESA